MYATNKMIFVYLFFNFMTIVISQIVTNTIDKFLFFIKKVKIFNVKSLEAQLLKLHSLL